MRTMRSGSAICICICAVLGCKKQEPATTPESTASATPSSAAAPASPPSGPAPSSPKEADSKPLAPAEQTRYDALFAKCQANDASACEAVCDDFDAATCTYLASQMLAKKMPDDPTKRAKINDKGCAKGAMKSCNQLGTAYKRGDGVPVDEKKAVELYAQACDGGDGGGCSHLADAYGYGDLVPQDIAKAKAMSTKACQLGYKDCAPPIGEGVDATWPVDAKLEDVIGDPKKWDGQLVQLRGVAAYRGSPTSGYLFAPGGKPLTDGVATMTDESASPDAKRDWLKMPSSRDGIPLKKVTVRVQATMVPGKARFFIVDDLRFYGSSGN